MKYYVISGSEDGEIRVEELTESEIREQVNPNQYGEIEIGEEGFVSEIKDNDPNYWGLKTLIIKGEIVVPKPKQVVTEYEL